MLKDQKMPQKKITKQVMRPAKPAGEGMGMAHPAAKNLGKWLHPAKKKG